MDIGLLARGWLLGFSIAAAVGPIALLTIRRTLADGRRIGLASGLGVATADALYGAVAAFGLSAISDVLIAQARPLGIIGGAFLIVLGVRTLFAPPPDRAAEAAAPRGLASAYLSILALTLTNPLTILSFAALFVGLGVVGNSGVVAALVVAGVFLGSLTWWVVLVGAVSQLRAEVTPRSLRWVNVVSGSLITAFGVVALGGAVIGAS